MQTSWGGGLHKLLHERKTLLLYNLNCDCAAHSIFLATGGTAGCVHSSSVASSPSVIIVC